MDADPYAGFPPGFFDRNDDGPDARFYDRPRLVTHIDEAAVAAVGDLYAELGIDGSAPRPTRVLDLMSSWVSHFRTPPADLVMLGMNADELAANPAATTRLVHDLNADPTVPLPDDDVDAAVCCVSIDYLTRPIEVLAELGRVLRPGGVLAVTFSHRCFPTKAVRGWLATDDQQHGAVISELVRRSGRFTEPTVQLRTAPGVGDPLYAVVATRRG
ncbi:methyltransferase domain-containing protein [Modestobacter sp. VKM Ac-2977]|uniref:class I SAM-dependent methyltransferase n=1 Tax=Modestobacter sp. VKM Ac-2977 TaxID=3004131 RepID=UPI0022AA472D|nr:methyltransferase domain-containing protein [Modestobacter sp. VKM Ac-2977]MCZ2820047.1 methyltransferase domain-containing protein [Modestobacter sp. VKM Ac-2977]